MGGPEINEFLTHLAVERNVSASAQTQALAAILFLYRTWSRNLQHRQVRYYSACGSKPVSLDPLGRTEATGSIAVIAVREFNKISSERKSMSNPGITASPASPEPSATSFGTAAISCLAYAALALLLMHILRPDLAPRNHMISEYAVGTYGWVMQSVFVGLSFGCAALLVGLARDGPTSIPARMGVLLLAVASIGLIVSAIYPMDLPGRPATKSGELHDLSFFVNVGSIALAIALLTASFGKHLKWSSYRRTSVVLLVLIALAFVLQFLTLRKGAPYGLANRFFIAVVIAWLMATSIRLRNLARY